MPSVLLGVWSGVKLRGGLNERGFRKLALALLFVWGAVLITR
jgi:uncharacterized membrane protein YfcA